ncbi:MAG: hypothetical protein AAFV53_11895 [Myxococcota bacterium]
MNASKNDLSVNPPTTLGELIAFFYDQFLEMYGDPDLASVAAAAVINDMLSDAIEDEDEPALSEVA